MVQIPKQPILHQVLKTVSERGRASIYSYTVSVRNMSYNCGLLMVVFVSVLRHLRELLNFLYQYESKD